MRGDSARKCSDPAHGPVQILHSGCSDPAHDNPLTTITRIYYTRIPSLRAGICVRTNTHQRRIAHRVSYHRLHAHRCNRSVRPAERPGPHRGAPLFSRAGFVAQRGSGALRAGPERQPASPGAHQAARRTCVHWPCMLISPVTGGETAPRRPDVVPDVTSSPLARFLHVLQINGSNASISSTGDEPCRP